MAYSYAPISTGGLTPRTYPSVRDHRGNAVRQPGRRQRFSRVSISIQIAYIQGNRFVGAGVNAGRHGCELEVFIARASKAVQSQGTRNKGRVLCYLRRPVRPGDVSLDAAVGNGR